MDVSFNLDNSLNFKDIIGNDINKNWNKVKYWLNNVLLKMQKNLIFVSAALFSKLQNPITIDTIDSQIVNWQHIINNYSNIYWKNENTFVSKINFIKPQNISLSITKESQTTNSNINIIIKNITEDIVVYNNTLEFVLDTININTTISFKKDIEYQIILTNNNVDNENLILNNIFLIIQGVEINSPLNYIKSSEIISDLDEQQDIKLNAVLKNAWINMESIQTVKTNFYDIFNNSFIENDDGKYDDVSVANVSSDDNGIAFIGYPSDDLTGIKRFGSLLKHNHIFFNRFQIANAPVTNNNRTYFEKVWYYDSMYNRISQDLSDLLGGTHDGEEVTGNNRLYTELPAINRNTFNKAYGIYLGDTLRVYRANVFIPTPRFV